MSPRTCSNGIEFDFGNGCRSCGIAVVAEMLQIGKSYESYEDAITALKSYEQSTNQLFINAHGHPKLSLNHSHYKEFKYSSMKFVCKHHGKWRSHRKDYVADQRPNQTTIKCGCPAFVKFKVVDGAIVAVSVPKTADHNHPVDPGIFQFYPENRKIQPCEKPEIQNLLDCGVQRSTICAKVNAQRSALGRSGRLTTRDVHKYASVIKAGIKCGRSEAQILEDFLQNCITDDPGADVYTVTNKHGDEAEFLNILYIQTTDMKNSLNRHCEAMFMDSTYRLNCEHFCLYSIVVEDENGFGQPVLLAFLSDEKKATLEKLFEIFINANAERLRKNQCIFVDKDFTQIAVLEKAFPEAKVLLCAFHTMKTWKTKLASQRLDKEDKERILNQFKRVLHAGSDTAFEAEEIKLKDLLSETLLAYYSKNWGRNKEMWAFAFQKHLLTFRNRTTNRIERWFLMIKTAFRSTGRSIWTRHHLKDCVEIVLKVVFQKLHIARFEDYVNKGKTLILHHFPSHEHADLVGKSLTKVAALIVQNQMKLYADGEYECHPSSPNEWEVTSIKSSQQTIYEVSNGSRGFVCSCYTNCTFGLPCRHIFHARKDAGLDLFAVSDVISKWHRGADEDCMEHISKEVMEAAIKGVPDEMIEVASKKRSSCTIGSRFSCAKKVCNRIASVASHFGGAQFASVMQMLDQIEDSLLTGTIPAVQTLIHDKTSRGYILRTTEAKKPKGRPNEKSRFKRFNKKARLTNCSEDNEQA